MKEVELKISKQPNADIHLIGIHATFRLRGRIIPGITYQDVLNIAPNGFLNVCHNVQEVMETNNKNPRWDEHSGLNVEETQAWMIEEEFVTEVLADVACVPMYIVARNHEISNLADLLLSKKKKIYLSYPITAVQDSNPELLEGIQGPILEQLEDLFVVFNPLSIEDMPLTKLDEFSELPKLVEQLTPIAKEMIKKRTVVRDFQYIDQSDAVVVFYLTEKVSPGVLAEVYYAHRTQKPVFMVFTGNLSPFMEYATTHIETEIEPLMNRLKEFAKRDET